MHGVGAKLKASRSNPRGLFFGVLPPADLVLRHCHPKAILKRAVELVSYPVLKLQRVV